jgi:hypothetical protein
MPRTPKPPKTDEQRDAERRRREFADKLELIAEYLGEEDFVSAVKGLQAGHHKGGTAGVDYAVFAPPCARSAGFTDDLLEILLGLL